MNIARYTPTTIFPDMTGSLRLFEDTFRLLNESRESRPWSPSVDIRESETEWVLKADLPDMKLEDIHISIENSTLILRGERKFENWASEGGFHRMERGYGAFARHFALSDTYDPDKIKATYDKGVLTVTLPKSEAAKPLHIKVSAGKN
jgi:HSP20 family protein